MKVKSGHSYVIWATDRAMNSPLVAIDYHSVIISVVYSRIFFSLMRLHMLV